MKKVLFVILTILISVAFVTTVFAQTSEKTVTTTTPEKQKETTTTTTTTPEKKVTTTTTTKTKAMTFTGKVTNMDTAEKMMTAKSKKGDMTFDVSSATMKVEPKAGDMVTVKYMEKDGKMMASSVTKGYAKKTKSTKSTTKKTKDESAGISSGAKSAGEPASTK
jgi:cytoskeletal protein RodZ